MDEFMDEVDVTYEQLYKLHTGHKIFDDSDASSLDSDNSFESDLDHLKPPLYTFKELQDNSVIIKPDNEDLNILGLEDSNPNVVKENDGVTVSDYSLLARYLLAMLSPLYCYICNMPSIDHYRKQYHNITFLKWILSSTHILEVFGIDNIDSVICFACRGIFFDSHNAALHYASDEHKHNMKTFCKVCLVHVDLDNHRAHINLAENDQQLKNYLNENLHIIRQKENNEEKISQIHPGKIVATELILMLTPVYCYICQIGTNIHNLDNHYFKKEHILMIRNWLAHKIRQSEVLNPNFIFCEVCNMALGGTELAAKHYQEPFHLTNTQMYCSVCVFRGDPTTIFFHNNTWEHQYNCKTLFNLLTNVPTATESVGKENNIRTPMPRELGVSSGERKPCGVMFDNREETQIHYNSENHRIFVHSRLEADMLGKETKVDSKVANQQKNKLTSVNNFDEDLIDFELKAPEITEKNEHFEAFKQKTKNKNNDNTDYDEISEIFEKNIFSKTPLTKFPTGKNISIEEAEIYQNINNEIKKILNRVFVSENIPVERTLKLLKKFNEELTKANSHAVKIEDKNVVAADSFVTCESEDSSVITGNDIEDVIACTELEPTKCKVKETCDTLFSSRSENSDIREDCVTPFVVERKSLQDNERQHSNSNNNISQRNTDRSSTHKTLNNHLSSVQGNVSKSNKKCIIL